MLSYILRRLLVFIPTLLVISLLGFVISINAPGDPVERILNTSQEELPAGSQSDRELAINRVRKQLGLDKPLFYFSLATLADPEELYHISNVDLRQVLRRMARETGRPEGVMEWKHLMAEFEALLENSDIAREHALSAGALVSSLYLPGTPEVHKNREDSLSTLVQRIGNQEISSAWKKAHDKCVSLYANPVVWKRFVPLIKWFGIDNQYHTWMFGDNASRKGVIRGDLGLSYRDGQPVSSKISDRLKWSLSLSLGSLIIALIVSIPVGMLAAYYRRSLFDRISALLFFMLFAVPPFFAGTLLLVLFANPDFWDWFPVSGIKDPALFDPKWPFWQRVQHYLPYLVLPLITYTYASLAFISRQVRSGIITELRQDYIRTARAKGLREQTILLRHAFRNTLLPLITIVSSAIPLAFGGSVIIETIFSIPGMGLEIYESIQNHDYPVIVSVFTLFGLLTVTGYLLADIGYMLADPRIRLKGRLIR